MLVKVHDNYIKNCFKDFKAYIFPRLGLSVYKSMLNVCLIYGIKPNINIKISLERKSLLTPSAVSVGRLNCILTLKPTNDKLIFNI